MILVDAVRSFVPSKNTGMIISGHQNGSHHPPSPSGVPPQFLGQMPPGFGGLDPTKLAKSPINTLKPSHLLNKDTMHGQKAPPFNPDAIFSGEGPVGASTGLPVVPPSGGSSTNRKCRALYGFEQKNKWCKPCRNKKRCVQFIWIYYSAFAGSQNGESTCFYLILANNENII